MRRTDFNVVKNPQNKKGLNHNSEKRNSHKSEPIFRLREMFKPSLDLWIFSWILGLVFTVSMIALLMVSGWFITSAALAGLVAVGSHTFNYMLPAGVIRMLAVARTAGRYGELMVSHHAVFDLLKTLRLRFFNQLAKLPLSKQRNALHASQSMHRLVSDIDKLDQFILRVISPWLIGTIVVILLAVFIMIVLPITTLMKLTLLVLLGLALLLPLVGTVLGIRQASEMSDVSESRRHKLLAPLSIITQLLLWNQWHNQSKPYIDQDNTLQQLEWNAQKQRTLYILGIQWLFYLCIMVVIYSIFKQSQSELSVTAFNVPLILAVTLGLLGIQEVVIPLGQHYLSLGNSIAAKNRLNALLTTYSNNENKSLSAPDSNGSQPDSPLLPLPKNKLYVALKHVYAKIPSALVGAQDVKTVIEAGTPLIVKGPSGCGKSTLLQMLAGELPILSGEVCLNGSHWQEYDWQDQLGYLGQQLDIFDQSLAANLRLGKSDATDSELVQVLEKVGLDKWLKAQPQGLETPLGEYGAAISGGQARRIALARLLLKPRRVLLLDEPFAGLDAETRELVWQNIKSHQKHDILVIVSHQEWEMGDVNSLRLKEGIFVS